jgi:fructosamine-3-kinase
MIGKAALHHLESELSHYFSRPVHIKTTIPVSGGSINEAYHLQTNAGDFFLKCNNAGQYPGMFETEAKGVNLLRTNSGFRIPEILFNTAFENDSFLLMEFIRKGARKPDFFEEFGRLLAAMHRKNNEKFGLDHDNYIGSLPQSNKQHNDWTSFFITERLERQLKLARDNSKLAASVSKQFENLCRELDSIFPKEASSLLHGDLWSGNFIADENGQPCIFDPAVYYGHREMDIAMTKLFGGFSEEFYESYREHYPMEKGWEERMEICNLYPLMVHVNLFGGGYAADVMTILKRFS